MGFIRQIITGLFLIIGLASYAQEENLQAGFRTIQLYDSSRGYKPIANFTDKLYYRPIDIDLWYPANVSAKDTTAFFYDLVKLLESRSKFYDDENDYDGISEELLQYICAGTNCSDYNTLKKLKTQSYVNAKPAEGRSPLIIYFAALNGMSYENYLLFESLARKGFIVASVSSIGRYPGNMTLEIEDLMEQIWDAKFIINYLAAKKMHSGNIGLVGYSWGGLAATLLSMMDPSAFNAVVSLNGSEEFHYHGDADDGKLDQIRSSPIFKPEAIRAPYLYLDSDLDVSDNLPDSIYNITKFITDKYYLKINGSAHEDFSCISVLPQKENKTKYNLVERLVVTYLLDKLKHEKIFYENIPDQEVSSQFLPVKENTFDIHQTLIKGKIRDQKTNATLPYVNIGIINKDVGTTTDTQGNFELKLAKLNRNDKLRISMVGYEPKEIRLEDLLKSSVENLTIHLFEKKSDLKEIVIEGKKSVTRILGNKTQSKFFGGKFASEDLGSEMAIRINVAKGPVYLSKFEFNISYNTGDTTVFRFNIYDVKNGFPNENILNKNIILRIGNQTGKIDLDLSQYDIIIDQDFFVSLEYIEGNKNSGIVFSAGFINKGTYYRKASQGRWKKYPMGVGFNVTASY